MSIEKNQNLLMSNEEARVQWLGDIHTSEETLDGEFLATTDRLIYDQEGVQTDINYNHISSVKTWSESRTITDGSDALMLPAVLGILFLWGGINIFSGGGSILATLFGFLLVIIGLLSFAVVFENATTETETTEKIIHHIRIARDNEPPLHMSTEKDVGATLRNLVAESKG